MKTYNCVPHSEIIEAEIDEALLNILNEKFLYHLLNQQLKEVNQPIHLPKMTKALSKRIMINYRPRIGFLNAILD